MTLAKNSRFQPTLKGDAKLRLAQSLFREFYARCFWHMKPDLIVSEPTLPLIIKGLRTHGGRRGVLAAAKLLE